jgi:FHS family L-fucose permease-like MFS transporter
MDYGKPKAQASDLLAVSQGLYMTNRFIAARLMVLPAFKPRLVLASYMAGRALFMAAAIPTKGNAGIGILIMVFCCESACFACIFATGMSSVK